MKKFIYVLLTLFLVSQVNAQKLKKLGIEFENTTYNFGDVQMWENQPAIFQLTNKSKFPISILPLFSETDLEIIYPEQSIAPGEKVIIKAIYYTGGTGSFTRKFPIYFNSSPEAYFLKITGNIKSLSPTAYIQCPQAKPEHSKPKAELYGNVAEIVSEIPLGGSTIQIIGLTTKVDMTLIADNVGEFGSKLPTGNYEIIVEHPNYQPHASMFYLGQQTGYLKIRLEPIPVEPVIAQQPKPTPQDLAQLDTKTTNLDNVIPAEKPSEVSKIELPSNTPTPDKLEQDDIDKKTESLPPYTPPSSADLTTVDKVENPEMIDEVYEALEEETEVTSRPPSYYPEEEVWETPTQSVTPVETSPNIISEMPKELTTKTYTVRVLDEKTLDPISDAEVFLSQSTDRKKTSKFKSNIAGIAEMEVEKGDYKVIVNADHYISGEAFILSDDDDGIIRIMLSSVSNLFEEIYAEKKKENLENDLLNQLSFGTTEFVFADEKEDEKKEEDEQHDEGESLPILASQIPVEQAETRIDQTEVEEIEILTGEQDSPTVIEQEEEELIELDLVIAEDPEEPSVPSLNIDSIQRYLDQLQADKEELERTLALAAEELAKKEELLETKEAEIAMQNETIAQKDEALEESEETIAQLAQDALENKNVEPLSTGESSDILSVEDYAANNVLFLIDISSSMGKENKMELLKESMKSMITVLRDIDRVAIIAYNQRSNVILESISGDNKMEIFQAIDSLETYGLTYGVTGLQTAYDLLQYYYIGDGNNQIILATDGLFSSANATMTENELNKEVRKQASNNGIKLSVIGFGQDEDGQKLMQKLANNGEGQFIQINNPWEAKTVLVDEIKLNSKK